MMDFFIVLGLVMIVAFIILVWLLNSVDFH